jgi:outer membrane protein OmpA-like peptidoglycan-associated protein
MNSYKKAILAGLFSFLSGCASTYTNKQLEEVFNQRGFHTEETDRGLIVLLPDVFFEYDKADLTYCAQSKIGEIASVVNDPKALQRNLLVEGHTDSSGSDEYNLELSNKRAKTVEKSLIDNKVAAERISARGFGEKYPVAQNTNPDGTDNPDGRAKNRRVEIIVKNPESKP